ncbi:MAG: hypothetical protein ACUVSY_16585 [Roseiflexus sp.]
MRTQEGQPIEQAARTASLFLPGENPTTRMPGVGVLNVGRLERGTLNVPTLWYYTDDHQVALVDVCICGQPATPELLNGFGIEVDTLF